MKAQGTERFRARRQFLQDASRMACGVGAVGVILGLHVRQARARPPLAIRPPGAIREPDFLGACIRCGLCVRACPYDILHLATPDEPVVNGTPYFIARDKPCEMCEDIPCVKACPTGALDPRLTDIREAKMGLAVHVSPETCLGLLGMRCENCHRACPMSDKALTLELRFDQRKHIQFIPTVHSEYCTGCGKCEKSCPLEVAAIKVYPVELVKERPDSHEQGGRGLKPDESVPALQTTPTQHASRGDRPP